MFQLTNKQYCGADSQKIISIFSKKDKPMNMTNRLFIRTVCPIIALLFFFATITPSVVQGQTNEKTGNSSSLCMLKLAMAGKNGQAILSQEERLAVKEKVLIRAENLFNQITQSGISDSTLQKYGYILTPGFTEKIMLVSDIAKEEMTTEKKLQALTGAFGYSCNDIMYVGVVAYVLNFFGIIPALGYAGNLLFAAAALCYLGVM